jgi:hypothetical protein
MTEYRFDHFRREHLWDALAFRAGPEPGWAVPDFDLPTLHGGRIRKADFAGNRPVLFTFASLTDPMAASAAPVLRRLHREWGDEVAFVTVYVREAHPGDRVPQPRTAEWKARHARMLADRDGLPWTVAVDDLEGSFHRAMGGNSNAAYLMDPSGNVAFRTLWSNDERVLGEALGAVARGAPAHPFERARRLVPLALGLSRVDEVVRAAGPEALGDLRREAPGVFLAAQLAWAWRALTPVGRLALVSATAAAALSAWQGSRLALRAARSSGARRAGANRRAAGTARRALASAGSLLPLRS